MVGWLNGEGRRALAIAALALGAAILTVSSSSVEHECILQFAVKSFAPFAHEQQAGRIGRR